MTKLLVISLAILVYRIADEPHEKLAAAVLLVLIVLTGVVAAIVVLRAVRRGEDLRTELRDLYDHAPCGYHTVDPNGVIEEMNETELRWLGYGREEVIGRLRLMDLVAPESLESFYDEFAPFIVNGSAVQDIHGTMVRKDGSRLPVLVSAVAIRDAEGRLRHIRGALMDRTEAARTQEELETTVGELEKAIASIRTLTGLLPICASCKKIRDDTGYWDRVESYISKHTEAQFSHGMCPDCFSRFYPDVPLPAEAAR